MSTLQPAHASATPRRELRPWMWWGAGLLLAVFLALGSWQVKRLFWKLDLIARVDARVHAAPSPAPEPGDWAAIDRDHDEYRHLALQGQWLPEHTLRVQAVTTLGPGFWVMTPLKQAGGALTWVNRGYVASATAPIRSDPGAITLSGLLRLSEPGGAFLRHNDPAHQRWFSRDVDAMSAAQGLAKVAPYFVDADADANHPNAAADQPVGGLTVVQFPNNHLVYALTWYGMAAGVLVALWVVRRDLQRNAERTTGPETSAPQTR